MVILTNLRIVLLTRSLWRNKQTNLRICAYV